MKCYVLREAVSFLKFDIFFHSYENIHMTFKSLTSGHRGFKLEFSTTKCDRNYTSEQGRIIHHGFIECWTAITVAANRTIALYFNAFSLYDAKECTQNVLQVCYSFGIKKILLLKNTTRILLYINFDRFIA